MIWFVAIQCVEYYKGFVGDGEINVGAAFSLLDHCFQPACLFFPFLLSFLCVSDILGSFQSHCILIWAGILEIKGR